VLRVVVPPKIKDDVTVKISTSATAVSLDLTTIGTYAHPSSTTFHLFSYPTRAQLYHFVDNARTLIPKFEEQDVTSTSQNVLLHEGMNVTGRTLMYEPYINTGEFSHALECSSICLLFLCYFFVGVSFFLLVF
jgi:urease accessory protein UreH